MRKYVAILIRNENSIEEDIFYKDAIEKFGGKVLFIYDNEKFLDIEKKLSFVKGILLTGGYDVGRLDFFLIKYALENNLNLFGICQGMQSMALYNTNNKLVSIGNKNHYKPEGYVHCVELKEESRISKILNQNKIMVNSYHLQTVLESLEFEVVGKSDDLLIEVIEKNNHKFQIGVQWHPERMLKYDKCSNILFEKFVN